MFFDWMCLPVQGLWMTKTVAVVLRVATHSPIPDQPQTVQTHTRKTQSQNGAHSHASGDGLSQAREFEGTLSWSCTQSVYLSVCPHSQKL